jgi:hypothetical protein
MAGPGETSRSSWPPLAIRLYCKVSPLLVVDDLDPDLVLLLLPMRPDTDGVSHSSVEVLQRVVVFIQALFQVR